MTPVAIDDYCQGGANFEVGGTGGPDSKLLMARVTPGELINVLPEVAAAEERAAVVQPEAARPTAALAAPAPEATRSTTIATVAATALTPALQPGASSAAPATPQQPPVINLTVNNNHPTARVESRRGPNGRDIEVIISEVVARDLHMNGPVARAMQQTHNLQRGAIGR